MPRFTVTILAASLWTFAGCAAEAGPVDTGKVEAASTDEMDERQVVLDRVAKAIKDEDFAALDAMALEYRSSRARTPSGVWKLAVYHAGLQAYLGKGLQREEGCTYRMADFVRRWREAGGDQPAAVITDASLLSARGWCVRGPGYANTVSGADWKAFEESAKAASALLERHKQKASVDPEFYAVSVKTYPALDRLGKPLADLVDEASRREPYYHRTYFNAAFYYLPQWGGSMAQVDEFARYAAHQTRESDKTGMYARIYWSLEQCGCDVMREAADWDDMKQAMRDVQARYPSPFNADHFMQVSCTMGDEEEGLHFIRAGAPPGTGDDALVARIRTCRTMAHDPSES